MQKFRRISFIGIAVLLFCSLARASSGKSCQELLNGLPNDLKGGLITEAVDFSTEALVEAYSNGIFPWKDLGMAAAWYRPETRGVLFFDQYHVSKSLKQIIKKNIFEVTFDQAFEDVIKGCRKAHAHDGEWISDRFVAAYTELHRAGFAHSVEVWARNPQTGERELAGGTYGVFVKGVFAGESMFRNIELGERSNNASKVAVYYLIERLKSHGHTWIDTQMVTEATEVFGAKTVSREVHMELLRKTQALGLEF